MSGAATDADIVAVVTKEDAATMMFEDGFTKPLATVQLSDKTDII